MPNVGPNFLSGTRFFTFCKADKGSRNAGGLNRPATGQLVTLKQETDSFLISSDHQGPGLQW